MSTLWSAVGWVLFYSVFVIILCWSVSTVYGIEKEKSGIRIRVTRRGLDYASALGSAILDDEIPNTPVPDVTATITRGPGRGHVILENVNITLFKSPEFSYILHPPKNLTFLTKGGFVKVEGDWLAWYKVLFNVSLSGKINASAGDIDIRMSAEVIRTPKGLPEVNVTSCSAEIGDLNLEIEGGVIQWIVNLFRHVIAWNLKHELAKQFCVSTQGILMDLANRELQTLPTEIPIYEQFYLHYALSKDPKIDKNFVQSQIGAEITWKGESATPVAPIPLPNATTRANASRMLYIWGSDYVLNTFLYTAHRHKAIQFLISKNMDTKIAQFLKTTCMILCIGRMVPEIGKKYPNQSLDIHVHSSSPPLAEIQPTGAILNATAFADIYLSPWNETGNLMFRTQITFAGSLGIRMVRRRVVGNLSIDNFHIQLVESHIGKIPPKALVIVEDAAKPVLQDLANKHLRRGLPVPTVKGAILVRPRVKLLERAIEIETDLSYKKYFPRRIMKNWKNVGDKLLNN